MANYEIRMHARGGQGSKLASKILAHAAFLEGFDVQAFSLYGSERRGAPVFSFCRFGDKIEERGYIENPTHLLIFDDTLLSLEGVKKGAENAEVFLNTKGSIQKPFECKSFYTMDISKITSKYFNIPVYSTGMLAFFLKKTGILKKESLKKAIEEVFEEIGKKEMVEKNLSIVEDVFHENY